MHASADTTRLGSLTKQGSAWLRWILVEVSVHAINGAPQFRSLYYRVAKKHGHNVGQVAVARALLKTIYVMLKKAGVIPADPEGTVGQRLTGTCRPSRREERPPQNDCATGVLFYPVLRARIGV